ncbi:hypothetical protein ABW19_dt0209795 [Dactylella cylindrospora]|nr:hypothetical protein ABW19_dt0209795 [Dactylella cylindrospora]
MSNFINCPRHHPIPPFTNRAPPHPISQLFSNSRSAPVAFFLDFAPSFPDPSSKTNTLILGDFNFFFFFFFGASSFTPSAGIGGGGASILSTGFCTDTACFGPVCPWLPESALEICSSVSISLS